MTHLAASSAAAWPPDLPVPTGAGCIPLARTWPPDRSVGVPGLVCFGHCAQFARTSIQWAMPAPVAVEGQKIMVRSRRAWLQFLTPGGLVVFVAILLWLGWVLASGNLDRNDKLASVAGMFIGLVGLVVSLVSLRVQLRQPVAWADDAERLSRAADALAGAVRSQWDAEAGLRALRQPSPLQLTWITTTHPVAAPADTVVGDRVPGRVLRLRLHGQLDQVAEQFLALPHQRLVVLGEPGAGKTVLAMLLTLELLSRRQPGESVPVLLSLASWDPTEHLRTWAARKLADTYPFLRHPDYGPDAVTRLVTYRQDSEDPRNSKKPNALLILDGLDELPEQARGAAIRALNQGADASWPLVVTSRIDEFKEAIAGVPLTAAAVVELQPVNAEEATTFLARAAPPGPRWATVFDELHNNPDGELAEALSSPLMVALARTVSAAPGREPSELVDKARSGGRTAVEQYLLDGFIPAIYANHPAAPGQPASVARRQWDPASAHRYLTFLATHLRKRDTQDLAWWQLPDDAVPRWPQAVPRWWVGFVVGVLGAVPAGLAAGLDKGSGIGVGIGLVVGLPVGLGIRALLRVRFPERVKLIERSTPALGWGLLGGLIGGMLGASTRAPGPLDGIAGGLAIGFATGGLCGPVGGLAGGLTGGLVGEVFASRGSGLPAGLMTGLGAALALGLVAGVTGRPDPAQAAGRTARGSVLALGFGLVLGTAIGVAALPRFGPVLGTVAALMAFVVLGGVAVLSGMPANLQNAASPHSVLASDRRTFWSFALIGGMAGALALFVGVSALVGVCAALVGALGLGFFQATWGRYTLARTYLAARGRLPWAITAFLDDAHRLGVLRQVGAVYQFRHALLRDHLAPIDPAPQRRDLISSPPEIKR
jgi:NACHT domain